MTASANTSEVQRAYTLKLRGRDNKDDSWRDSLWKTHMAINDGAKAFGDWLLTIRGGLDYKIADGTGKDAKSEDERKARRILLTLSWLSVESKRGAPEDYIVVTGGDRAEDREKRLERSLREILEKQGAKEEIIESWIGDCKGSLRAEIRKDAVWVNRSCMFERTMTGKVSRNEAMEIISRFFGKDKYFSMPADEERAEEKGFREEARGFISEIFGAGVKSDFEEIAGKLEILKSKRLENNIGKSKLGMLTNLLKSIGVKPEKGMSEDKLIKELKQGLGWRSGRDNQVIKRIKGCSDPVTEKDIEGLRNAISREIEKKRDKSRFVSPVWSHDLRKRIEKESKIPYRQEINGKGKGSVDEYSVMLDQALRRVSMAHTWIKRMEKERLDLVADISKQENLPEATRRFLDDYCDRRAEESGSLEPYIIRKRAIGGWEEIVKKWARCRSEEERIEAARELQNNQGIEKYGDSQLFEALAEKEATCVWQNEEGEPTHEFLGLYVAVKVAEERMHRIKIPAYRHPDPMLHPVFCEYGKSRLGISFKVHTDIAKLRKDEERLAKKKRPASEYASEEEKKKKIEDLMEKEKTYQESKAKVGCFPECNAVDMNVWNGGHIEKMRLSWGCTRLVRDLALKGGFDTKYKKAVTRADRLGRAAAGANDSDAVEVANLFLKEQWNGRLQAPREQLESLARHVERCGWDEKADLRKRRLEWFITFSPSLKPIGPWVKYAEGFPENAVAKPVVRRRNNYQVEHRAGPKRGSLARLGLCRLPGLRILAVDLGLRYAAACAVWETLSSDDMRAVCRSAKRAEPQESDLYLHIKEGRKRVIYRRIGPDKMPGGEKHPAPWARLDRQFLIKLQGEGGEVRAASNDEIWQVHCMEKKLGCSLTLLDSLYRAGWGNSEKQKERLEELKERGWEKPPLEKGKEEEAEGNGSNWRPSLAVDEMMASAVRTVRLALKRHGDLARVAFALRGEFMILPGGRKYYFKEAKEESGGDDKSERHEKDVENLQKALLIWYRLFSNRRWSDDNLKELWDKNIASRYGCRLSEENADNETPTGAKAIEKRNLEILRSVAEKLAAEVKARKELHVSLCNYWNEKDRELLDTIRWLKDWVIPKGRMKGDPSIRYVGGLSLTRISTITELRRQVQVGYYTRLHPDGTRTEIGEKFGGKVLRDLEELREQRVRQIASRIVEAALGLGRVKAGLSSRSVKRPREQVDASCHAVVVENLRNYLPEEMRTRRENRRLMTWSAGKVREYLKESCTLYGLGFFEVSAQYTSRQDSRTGSPGIRCQDISIGEFMHSPFWHREVTQAEKRISNSQGSSRDKFLHELNEIWTDRENEWGGGGVLRIPLRGGEIFVSADKKSPAARGLQADLNAAANIGLRALTDPDWPGRWWYVPCNSGTFKPVQEKTEGSAAIDPEKPLRPVTSAVGSGIKSKSAKKGKAKKEVINLWRDISSTAVHKDRDVWKIYDEYWNQVQSRVIDGILRK